MSMDYQIKNKGKGKIFDNKILEFFTKTNPIIHLISFGLNILLLLYLAEQHTQFAVTTKILIYLSGLFFWTIFEYYTHRYIFHWVNESTFVKKITYAVHGVHHEFPKDEQRTLMPPLPGWIIIGLLFFLFYLVIGNFTFLFLPGMITGYLIYSMLHWAMHVHQAPKFLRNLWKHHNLHHYRYPEKAFGVSSTFWDRVFGTMPPKT